VVGVLDVESRDPAAFDEGDLAALTSVADHLAAALHNARLYRQVTDKNRELRDSERNKSDFLSIVAHDLRTPLTSIRSAAEMILMYRDEPPEVTEEFTRSIRDEAARLGRLVDDFLAHSRMEAGILDYEVGEVDLAALLEHFCRVFDGPASQKGIVMELSVASNLPPALADAERLSQAIANLLSNATKFTPEGGRIRVTAWTLPAEPDQVIGRVRVDVSDTGPGIEECHRERIFQKFVRLDGAAGGGAGLGLPIARAIIEHLGGKLWLDCEPGAGATFSFVLPARLR
jgi:signal transduction histidine kinase